MNSMLVSSGTAGVIILGHTLLTKTMMTGIWRIAKAGQLGADNWMMVKDKLEKIPLYQIMQATQLNEAEYAGPLAAVLFFLAAKGVDAPIASTLAVFGQVGYYWPRVFLANKDNYNNGFPFYVPAAVARYVAVGMLVLAAWKVVS